MRSREDAFCITSPLWGKSTGHWWISLTKRPMVRRFSVSLEIKLSKLLNKQWSRPWIETPWRPFDITVTVHMILLYLSWLYFRVLMDSCDLFNHIHQNSVCDIFVPWVGDMIAPFVNFSVRENFDFVKNMHYIFEPCNDVIINIGPHLLKILFVSKCSPCITWKINGMIFFFPVDIPEIINIMIQHCKKKSKPLFIE